MRQLSDSLYLHRDTCNVYVIKHGREAVLIDFGDGSVMDGLAAIGVDRVSDVLMTHHHRDQGQGLSRVAEAGIRIWVPEAEQELFAAVDRHWWARELANNYNNREDRFSLLEPVKVAGVLQDYRSPRFGAQTFTVVPTPGHTTGSISLLTEVDGRRVAFTGDLIYAPGKLWSLAATQWTYNGGEGIPGTILSLLDLKDRAVDWILPSHGEPMTDPVAAIDLTVERLANLRNLRLQNPRLFLLRDQPYLAITPHLLFNRTSMANSYVLRSESGKALIFDFGYDFQFGVAAGADRASRRPWLYTLEALKEQHGISQIDVVLPTHYHDDHVAGINLLREVEGTQHWCPESFAAVLEQPDAEDLPCLWYDPIPVDRRLPMGQPIQWEEYTLTLHPMPGHTFYAVAISLEVDGHQVLITGDQMADGDGLFLNYVYKNGFEPADFVTSAEIYREVQPDLILSGHWEPIWVKAGYLEALEERGQELNRLHRELLPLEQVDFGRWGTGARISPYRATLAAGTRFEVTVTLRNPFPTEEEAEVRLVLPSGWGVVLPAGAPVDTARVQLPEHGKAAVRFLIQTPSQGPCYRARIAADLTVGGHRFGQQAEALITLE